MLWTSHNIVIYTQKTPSVTCETPIIFPLFGAVSSKQHIINICMQELAYFFLMKPVFIQSWTIPRKYFRSANLPLDMSQMAAMKMLQFLPHKTHSTRNDDAFTHYGISLIPPNTWHWKYSSSLITGLHQELTPPFLNIAVHLVFSPLFISRPPVYF